MVAFLRDDGSVYDAIEPNVSGAGDRRRVLQAVTNLAREWSSLDQDRRRAIVRALVGRVEVSRDGVELTIRASAVASIVEPDNRWETETSGNDGHEIRLHVPAKLKRVGKGNALVINGPTASDRKLDQTLLRLLARAHHYRDLILTGDGRSMAQIADELGVGASYFSRIVRLAFLAPDIVNAIVEGRQPEGLTAKRLSLGVDLPVAWDAQSTKFGHG